MNKLLKSLTLCIFALSFSTTVLAAEKGSAEEATALVKKAVAYLNANGKEKAFAEFSNPTGSFVDRDLYIMASDLHGMTLAHGANPKLVGKNMFELKDADGKFFVKSMNETAQTKGKGWNDYKWPNPITKAIEPKSTYFERVGDVVIACGIYK